MNNTLGISCIVIIVLATIVCMSWASADPMTFSNAAPTKNQTPQYNKDKSAIKDSSGKWRPINVKAIAQGATPRVKIGN